MMDGVEQGQGTVGKLMKRSGALRRTRAPPSRICARSIASLNTILADLNAGKGTAGKLLKSDELHDQLKGTIGRLDTMLDKINSGQGTLGQLLVNPSLYRIAGRHNARAARAVEGLPRQSEEVPAHQAGLF